MKEIDLINLDRVEFVSVDLCKKNCWKTWYEAEPEERTFFGLIVKKRAKDAGYGYDREKGPFRYEHFKDVDGKKEIWDDARIYIRWPKNYKSFYFKSDEDAMKIVEKIKAKRPDLIQIQEHGN